MGLHLYGIVPAGSASPGVHGVDGAAVRTVVTGALAVLVSEHDTPPAASVEALRVHNAVVARAMTRDVTPVPVRFGQWVEDDAALAERIGAGAADWEQRLAAFAGRAEFGVTAFVADGAGDAAAEQDVRPDTGTGYMQALARRQAAAAARRDDAARIAADFEERLGTIATDTRTEMPAAGALLVRIAHLVAWTDEEPYHAAVRALREAWPQVQFHPTGPWPPWSFA